MTRAEGPNPVLTFGSHGGNAARYHVVITSAPHRRRVNAEVSAGRAAVSAVVLNPTAKDTNERAKFSGK